MHSGIRRPVRRGQQHLVAGVAEHLERVVDRVLAAVGDEHLLGRTVEAGVALGLVRDRGRAARAGPASASSGGTRVSARGRDRGLDDVLGRREVGLAGAEADHVLARGLQRLGLGVDRERGRLVDGGDAGGDASHGSMVARVRPRAPAVLPHPTLIASPVRPSLAAHAPPHAARRARGAGGAGDVPARGRRRPRRRRPRRPLRLPKPRAGIVVDAGSGRPLVCDNMHEAVPPASTAKIMTALVAVERLPEAPVTITVNRGRGRGEQDRLTAGQTLPLDQAIASLMMVSANDAAYAIATTVGQPRASSPRSEERRRAPPRPEAQRSQRSGRPGRHDIVQGWATHRARTTSRSRRAMRLPCRRSRNGPSASLRLRPRACVPLFLKNHNRMLPGGGYDYAGITGFKTGYTDQRPALARRGPRPGTAAR